MIETLQLTAATALWLTVMFVPMEWAFPARQAQERLRPGFAADLMFFLGQHLVFATAAAWIIAQAIALLPAHGSIDALRASVAGWPLALQIAAVVVLGDLCAYWGHRLQHAWEPLWRFHAVHHTTTHVDWLAAHREHPVDGLYTQAIVNLPALLLGFSLEGVLGLVAFRAMWAIFIHSNVKIGLGPLALLLGSPELHHWHHAKDRDVGNYANLAPYWDWLFGTYHRPRHKQPRALGIDEPHPQSYVGLLLWPFRRIGALARRPDPVETVRHPRR